ncbi:MAG TPA: molybdopterin-dependent oxidoreductase, partial [Acidimicrobiales bacterium]|nr:molybdopterin-dependent oxidoreductase [Acidimicrobiales bacterium]
MRVTRGFSGRSTTRDPRLPPGQYDVGTSWPVLSAEATPRLELSGWSIAIDGLVEDPRRWSWDELHELPPAGYEGDIHCVTTWSRLGMSFRGVSLDTLFELARPQRGATHVLAWSVTGYSTNLPLADVTAGQAYVVWEADGEPLATEHGGPVRLLVPHLYFWKSAKW